MRLIIFAVLLLFTFDSHGYRVFPFKSMEEEGSSSHNGQMRTLGRFLAFLAPEIKAPVPVLPRQTSDQDPSSLGQAWRMWASRSQPVNLKKIPMFRRVGNL